MRTQRIGRWTACGLMLLAAVSVHAQVPGPRAAQPQLQLQFAPGKPVLINPADGHRLQATSGVPTQIFTWDAPPGAPVPEFYTLHFEDADNPQGFRASVTVEHRGARTSTQQIIPPPLANRRIRWRVQACVRTNGMPAAASRCGQSAARLLTWSTAVAPPQLLAPAAGAAVGIDVAFRWTTPQGANGYLLCVSKPGVACPLAETSTNETVVVRRNDRALTSATVDLWRFRGQTVHWTVAACGGSGACTYQSQVRGIEVGAQAPALAQPAPASEVSRIAAFSWSTVDWAQYYTLCVSRPGVACAPAGLSAIAPENAFSDAGGRRVHRPAPGGGSQTHLYKSFHTEVNADLGTLTGTLHWTVAACAHRLGVHYCRYQPAVRSLKHPSPPLRRWLEVTLREVHVGDTCDSASPGDWTLRWGASLSANRTTVDSQSRTWPASGSRNVGGGDLLRVGEKVRFEDVRPDAVLHMGATAVDCDADGIWTPFRLFQGTEGIAAIISDWQAHCGGEEIWEASGHNDVVGVAHIRLDPTRWHGASRRLFSAQSGPDDRGRSCARRGFIAHFEVTSSQ